MSENVITGRGKGAYQPWQLASFDPPHSGRMPTAAEMENVHRQARDEGYAAGYAEGRKQGEAEAERLGALLDGARASLAQLDQNVADQLLALALDIAKRLVSEALAVKPELVLPVVQEAVRCLPDFEGPVRILLHPADAALAQSYLSSHAASGDWIIAPDPSLERGGCVVKTATTEIDATLSGRWRAVLAALGQDRDWFGA